MPRLHPTYTGLAHEEGVDGMGVLVLVQLPPVQGCQGSIQLLHEIGAVPRDVGFGDLDDNNNNNNNNRVTE